MLFSVISISKDNLEGLRRTHASLTSQTCRDFEWIVIDGASGDETPAFLKTTNAKWVSEPDNGLYHAMNKGIERAKGKYLLFLNAGDALYDETTLKTIKAQASDAPALIYGDSHEDDHYKPARPHAQIKAGLFTHHQAIFYNREALGYLHYNQTYTIAADYDLTARFLSNETNAALYIPVPLCIFESGGISQKSAQEGRKQQFEIRRALKLCSPLQNAIIYSAQTLLWNFRQYCPNLYWHLKSSRNNAPALAQTQTPPHYPQNQA